MSNLTSKQKVAELLRSIHQRDIEMGELEWCITDEEAQACLTAANWLSDETPAEPCSACTEAHAQIGDFGIADGDIADRVGDLIERLCDCEISLGTFDPGAVAEYWLKYGSRAPEASPVKTSGPPDRHLGGTTVEEREGK